MKKTVAVMASAAALLLAGCASPGLPKPPSLNLANPVSDLQAQRVDARVLLHWTMPTDTTDGVALARQRRVNICRRVGAGVCEQVATLEEMPRVQAAKQDDLPGELLRAAPELLTYEVQVLNAAGRSAGASNPAYAASGAAPAAVTELRAEVTEAGVVLRWRPAADAGAEVMLRRERVNAPAAKANPLGSKREPEAQMLRVRKDEGGTLDASAVFGEQYAYSAQRVRRLTLAGQSVEVRSERSAAVSVDMKDVFPPKPPTGLEASEPMRAADGSYAVDLSWDANTEPDLAGYFVYREDLSAPTGEPVPNGWRPKPLSGLLPTPAFHDAGAQANHEYAYSVSAVDKSRNESGRSVPVPVSVPQQ